MSEMETRAFFVTQCANKGDIFPVWSQTKLVSILDALRHEFPIFIWKGLFYSFSVKLLLLRRMLPVFQHKVLCLTYRINTPKILIFSFSASVNLTGYVNQFCLLHLHTRYCRFCHNYHFIIRHVWNVFQARHILSVKFHMGFEKNMIFHMFIW